MRFLDQKRQAGASIGLHFAAQIAQIFFERGIISRLAILGKTSRPLRIIKIVNRRLGEDIAAAVACRVKRIAVEFDWPSIDCGDEERDRPVTPRHRRRIIEKLARNGPFHAFREWDQMRFRPPATTHAKPGERDRCAHQFQKAATRPFIAIQLRRTGWELALEPGPKLRRIA